MTINPLIKYIAFTDLGTLSAISLGKKLNWGYDEGTSGTIFYGLTDKVAAKFQTIAPILKLPMTKAVAKFLFLS